MPKKGPEGEPGGERVEDRDQAHMMAEAGKRLRDLARNANFDEIKDKFEQEAEQKEEEIGEKYGKAKKETMVELSRIAEHITSIDQTGRVEVVERDSGPFTLADKMVVSEVEKLIKPKPISELTGSDYTQDDRSIIAIRESTEDLDLALREYYAKDAKGKEYSVSEISEMIPSPDSLYKIEIVKN